MDKIAPETDQEYRGFHTRSHPMIDAFDPLAPLDSTEAGRIVYAASGEGDADLLDTVQQILTERREKDREFGPQVVCVKCKRKMARRDAVPVGKLGSTLCMCPHCHYTCEDVDEVRVRLQPDSPEALKRVQQIANRWLDESHRMHAALSEVAANKKLPLLVRAKALSACSPTIFGADPSKMTREFVDRMTAPSQMKLNSGKGQGS